MVVQHNLAAMNANRMLGITTKGMAKSTEKLSSGYKINRAADNSAGLSISERTRKQIRGLSQSALNAEDGISCVQTADGALNEMHLMLERMSELAVKSANDTNSETDRSYIQAEVDQLVMEVDRISCATKFNEIYLLKGVDYNGTPGNLTYSDAINHLQGITGFDTISNDGRIEIEGILETVNITTPSGGADSLKAYKYAINGKDYYFAAEVTNNSCTLEEGIKCVTGTNQEAFSSYTDVMNKIREEQDLYGDIKFMNVTYSDDGRPIMKIETFSDINHGNGVALHVGADPSNDNKVRLNIDMMSARGLGLNGIRVTGDTSDLATMAIDKIALAMARVSSQRGNLGSLQNRLEHTVANLDNVVENSTAAESQIRDTDMATEMVHYSNGNILTQAGQSMLSQANQSNSYVLNMLG